MFPLLANGAKVFKNNVFLLRFVPNNEPGNRFCFSVSKKVAKNAVVRNRLRRTGYRYLNQYLPEIQSKIIAVFSFKIIPKKDEEIIKSLEAVLKESNLIK